ncbi:MAG: hypothetical protein AABZ15_09700 [Nitrospirota bacterium]
MSGEQKQVLVIEKAVMAISSDTTAAIMMRSIALKMLSRVA